MRPPGIHGLASHPFFMIVAVTAVGLACEGDASPPLPAAGQARCLAPREVSCVDQTIATLRLLSAPNPAAVSTAPPQEGIYESQIDATGGGLPPSQSYVYVRFGEAGLEKVAIGDEQAFESMGWDIAFRRYLIRVNGGVSGPACVDVARAGTGPLTSLQQVPSGLQFQTDLFLEPTTCAASENTDLMGGPLTALADYWSYEACVAMTGENFVIRLANGRYVAMQVVAFYEGAVQDFCNREGRLPGGPSGAGQMVIRWKYLEAPAS
jgi:hypothetical protein